MVLLVVEPPAFSAVQKQQGAEDCSPAQHGLALVQRLQAQLLERQEVVTPIGTGRGAGILTTTFFHTDGDGGDANCLARASRHSARAMFVALLCGAIGTSSTCEDGGPWRCDEPGCPAPVVTCETLRPECFSPNVEIGRRLENLLKETPGIPPTLVAAWEAAPS